MPSRESQNQAEPPCRLADEETEARHGPAAGLRPSASGQLCGSLGPRPRLPLPGYGDARPTACAPPLRRPTRQVRLTPRVAPPHRVPLAPPRSSPLRAVGPAARPSRRLAQGGVPRQPCWPQAPWLPGLAGASAHTCTHCTLPGPEPGPEPGPAWSGARCRRQDAQGSPPAAFLLTATLGGSGSPPLHSCGNGGSGTKAHPGSPCVRDKPELRLNQRHWPLGRGLAGGGERGAHAPLQTLPGPGPSLSHPRHRAGPCPASAGLSGDPASPGPVPGALVRCSHLCTRWLLRGAPAATGSCPQSQRDQQGRPATGQPDGGGHTGSGPGPQTCPLSPALRPWARAPPQASVSPPVNREAHRQRPRRPCPALALQGTLADHTVPLTRVPERRVGSTFSERPGAAFPTDSGVP